MRSRCCAVLLLVLQQMPTASANRALCTTHLRLSPPSTSVAPRARLSYLTSLGPELAALSDTRQCSQFDNSTERCLMHRTGRTRCLVRDETKQTCGLHFGLHNQRCTQDPKGLADFSETKGGQCYFERRTGCDRSAPYVSALVGASQTGALGSLPCKSYVPRRTPGACVCGANRRHVRQLTRSCDLAFLPCPFYLARRCSSDVARSFDTLLHSSPRRAVRLTRLAPSSAAARCAHGLH